MASGRMQLIASRTKLNWLDAARYVKQFPAGPQLIGGAAVTPSTTVRNLGVMVDLDLSLQAMSTKSRPYRLLPHPAVATSSPLTDVG